MAPLAGQLSDDTCLLGRRNSGADRDLCFGDGYFGMRFSNLTDRGTITNGPYRYFKHPAYVSKNISWWLMYMPFLSKVDLASGFRACLLLAAVNYLYYLRAKSEEKQLMADPAYRAYSEWIAEHGLLERAWRAIKRKFAKPVPAMQAAE